MATYVFKLPDIGEGIAEAEIVTWYVEVGDAVTEDQPLVEVMTDKATVEISAPVSGIILSRRGTVGMKAKVGDELVTFATAAAEAVPADPQPTRKATVENAMPTPDRPPGRRGLAAPAVRARAAALGINLDLVAGSGPEGRVLHQDLDGLAQKPQDPAAAAWITPPGGTAIPVIGLRRKIAERMQDANRRIPHFTYIDEVDVTRLEALRRTLNDAPQGPRLTPLAFMIRALVKAIALHPGVNTLFDDTAGVLYRYAAVHVGIATQTPRGLLVPVIRHAERLDLSQLAAEITRLSTAARAGKSLIEDLSGSTITVTSLGVLGGLAATPIINAPEVAIIGVNRIALRPVVVDGAIVIRKMMNLSSSFDHRIIDGFAAAAFIQTLKQLLETSDPADA